MSSHTEAEEEVPYMCGGEGCTYVYMSMCVPLCVCICVCIGRPEADITCLSLLFSIFKNIE